MIRDPARFVGTRYDVIVVGGGIHGACVARDAALRGLHVALVERGDFGNATSHNSFKLIHGGLRYLQHADISRVRASIAESRFWLRAAPDLVRPLKFVMPTYGFGTRGPLALRAALAVHRYLGRDRATGGGGDECLPAGEVVSRNEMQSLMPGVSSDGLTGGAIWYDGQMRDADALLRRCVRAAAEAGADVANYVEVTSLRRGRHGIEGVLAMDHQSGRELEISGRVTVNCCGPWVEKVINMHAQDSDLTNAASYAKGMNLVTRRIGGEHAMGVVSEETSDAAIGRSRRLYFITPWLDCSIIGTTAVPYSGDPDDCAITETEIEAFIADINRAYPPAALTRADVRYCYGGLTPASGEDKAISLRRARHGSIVDHFERDGVAGLVSVIGVKFTTTRLAAELAVDLACTKLDARQGVRGTRSDALPGEESDGAGEVSDIQSLCHRAMSDEMSMRLSDVVFRRTDRLVRGLMTEEDLESCALAMSKRFGWNDERRAVELDEVRTEIERHHGRLATATDAGALRPASAVAGR